MHPFLYLRLIGFTAGTLLQLFWMVVILGYRRQRNFERVFFFFCLALFLFYSGSLLALNAQIYYPVPPLRLREFAIAMIVVGLSMLPALLVHLHIEFAETRGLLRSRLWKYSVLALLYAVGIHLVIHLLPTQITSRAFDFLLPAESLGDGFKIVFLVVLVWSALWEFRFWRIAPDQSQRYFFALLTVVLAVAPFAVLSLHFNLVPLSMQTKLGLGIVFALFPVVPLAALVYLVQRHNFLQIGSQKNLLYAVSSTFLALLYLSLVRRVGLWLEPVLPPEASAAILLFVLVIFIEPLQRLLGRSLQETAQRELDRVQRLIAEIQQEARQGDLRRLMSFIEREVKATFELSDATVALVYPDSEAPSLNRSAVTEAIAANRVNRRSAPGELRFLLSAGTDVRPPLSAPPSEDLAKSDRSLAGAIGVLTVKPHGAALSGETRAALEFLCEQLPAALHLCRLIGEKLQLERELAERERLAILGQMAASISHNLKNPLGSIKTILQVQMENPDLPESVRGETQIVLEEIGRLSSKLNQLLQFSRPAIRTGGVTPQCDIRAIAEDVVAILHHEAEARGVSLELQFAEGAIEVASSPEAVSDILTNLLVNALEAVPRGGHVRVSASAANRACILTVEDDGPGIPASAQEKILQPFFTTKTKGTGLGLAIVARRVAESNGQLSWQSPIDNALGTRFQITLPVTVTCGVAAPKEGVRP